jgi:SagB-type dehydrogenase family enzyme
MIDRNTNNRAVYLYQPEPHALAKLRIANDSSLEALFDSIDGIINARNATMLWFAAQFDRTLSRYKNGESLVWRDSGALVATIALVAECLHLSSCAIGITGEPFISQSLASKGALIGVGGLLIGQR